MIPTFTVEKLAPGRWQVMRFDAGRTIGNKLGTFETRTEAVQRARLLAGRTGVVHLFERLKRA